MSVYHLTGYLPGFNSMERKINKAKFERYFPKTSIIIKNIFIITIGRVYKTLSCIFWNGLGSLSHFSKSGKSGKNTPFHRLKNVFTSIEILGFWSGKCETASLADKGQPVMY